VALLFSSTACRAGPKGEEGESGPDDEEKKSPVFFAQKFLWDDDGGPEGFTPIRGRWRVDGDADVLRIAPEPLIDGWIEFGPEMREQGAGVFAVARAGAPPRIRPRFGVGLFGKNGFQLRLSAGPGTIEIVRHGESLVSAPFAWEADVAWHFDLRVEATGEKAPAWVVSGRIWREGTERPSDPQLTHRAPADTLLFPLAGRAVLIATPFSGEPVSFVETKLYRGAWSDEIAGAPKEGERPEDGGPNEDSCGESEEED